MIAFMKRAGGIGLASNQIGLDVRLFVMKSHTLGSVMIVRPEYEVFIDELVSMREGCLSIPNETFIVTRPRFVSVSYITSFGERKEADLDGLDARVFLHEIDHLNGILCSEISNES